MKKSNTIIIGNWKMNPMTAEEAKHIATKSKRAAAKLERTTVVLCPPFPFIQFALSRSKSNVHSGAQNVYFAEQGAFTGEVSAHELASLGVEYVIVGHSERRAMGESDADISKKAAMVAQAGMLAILCVGEKIRDSQGEYLDVLREQIKLSLQAFPKKSLSRLIVAYEPVWDIGGRKAMTPPLVRETGIFVKKVLSDIYGQEQAAAVPILYGGSVNFRNAADIIRFGEVDGLLVGHESINVSGFVELLKVVDMI